MMFSLHFFMESPTLSYNLEEPDLDINQEVTYPVTIHFEFRMVEYAKPTKRELRLSARPLFDAKDITFEEDDLSDFPHFYQVFHTKVTGLPNHNKFFVFTDTQDWNGFVRKDEHLKYLAIYHPSSLLTFFNDTYFSRATRLRGQSTIPIVMRNFLSMPLPSPSPVRMASLNASNISHERRERIFSAANSSENIDVRSSISPERMQHLVIDLHDPYITLIPINPEFRGLLISLNATLTCMQLHLAPRGRCIDVDQSLVEEIVLEIIDRHSQYEEEDDEEEINDENDDTEYDERNHNSYSFQFPISE